MAKIVVGLFQDLDTAHGAAEALICSGSRPEDISMVTPAAGDDPAKGGLIGTFIDLGMPQHDARLYAAGVKRGNFLVVAQTSNEDAEAAQTRLCAFFPINIDALPGPWRDQGWQGDTRSLADVSVEDLKAAVANPPAPNQETGVSEAERAAIRVYAARPGGKPTTPLTADALYRDQVADNLRPTVITENTQAATPSAKEQNHPPHLG